VASIPPLRSLLTESLARVLKKQRAMNFPRGEFGFPSEDGSLTTHEDHVDGHVTAAPDDR
jgi:hypothetical protein